MQDLTEVISKRRAPWPNIWPLLAVGVLGLSVAIAAGIAISDWENSIAKAKFNDVAGDYATVLQNGLDHYLDKIIAVRASTPRLRSIATSSQSLPARFCPVTTKTFGSYGVRGLAPPSVRHSLQRRGNTGLPTMQSGRGWMAQGPLPVSRPHYYFSRPVKADQVTVFLREGRIVPSVAGRQPDVR